jgi:hypothetical protein
MPATRVRCGPWGDSRTRDEAVQREPGWFPGTWDAILCGLGALVGAVLPFSREVSPMLRRLPRRIPWFLPGMVAGLGRTARGRPGRIRAGCAGRRNQSVELRIGLCRRRDPTASAFLQAISGRGDVGLGRRSDDFMSARALAAFPRSVSWAPARAARLVSVVVGVADAQGETRDVDCATPPSGSTSAVDARVDVAERRAAIAPRSRSRYGAVPQAAASPATHRVVHDPVSGLDVLEVASPPGGSR